MGGLINFKGGEVCLTRAGGIYTCLGQPNAVYQSLDL